MSNSERLEYIREYFEKQQDVLVEISPFITTQYNGTKVIRRFEGHRMGNKYRFKNGKCWIKREDLATMKQILPNLIIHENEV